jgi:hypothetical protein
MQPILVPFLTVGEAMQPILVPILTVGEAAQPILVLRLARCQTVQLGA